MLTSASLIFSNLEKRKMFFTVIHTKNSTLNDKKNIDIVTKMLQENDITPNAKLISLR